ncbi:SRR1-like protein isoform X2 [Hyla sarda]|uniref:SRR1-like protein isoform X2 n=1 Tax=Hyla sarda TaxID=327740 RepID=UPI0024C39D92|nr:SRR1-like protein isoform X2 [Hyla sarda]
MESDTWQVVGKKKATKKLSHLKENVACNPAGSEQPPILYTAKDCTDVMKRMNDTMGDLRTSNFWKCCQGCLLKCQEILPVSSDDSSIKEEFTRKLNLEGSISTCVSLQHCNCVCYGLGNFTSCVVSRNQMALLLLFMETFKIPRHQCYVFDPIFSPLEIAVLQKLGLTVLMKNEEGKHAVCKPTVFYMLHCGKALYNNLLWKNWSCDSLSQMIIIGNSFKGIEERLLSRILQRDYMYVYKQLTTVLDSIIYETAALNERIFFVSLHGFLPGQVAPVSCNPPGSAATSHSWNWGDKHSYYFK